MKKLYKIFAMFVVIVMVTGILCAGALAAGPPPGPPPPPPAAPVVATKTAELTDFGQVDSKTAVGIMIKLGMINGIAHADKTVTYNPDGNLTRAEMAKLIALAVNLVSKEKITGTTAFADIQGNWAADYIKYCADKDIIDGINGFYNPNGTITGLETAKLLLAAMGVTGLTGDDWATKTQAAAAGKGLFEGAKAVDSTPIDRDDAAQIIYNALKLSDGAAKLPQMVVVSATTKVASLAIGSNALITAPEGSLVTLIAGGQEKQIAAGTYTDVTLAITDKFQTNPSSYSGRGIDDYRAAVYVDKTGLVDELSVSEAVSGGTVTASAATGITINSTSDNFNGIMVNGTEYTVKDSTFNFISNSDGSKVSDFNGFGAVVSAFNDAKVTMDNVNISTEGVARLALFDDSYSDALIKDSTIKVMGGTLYEGYVNTADQTKMVAPPWVLGITGNARATNLMGKCSTTTVVGTDAAANQWGVLSTDSGSDMVLTVVDSVLTLLGEGQTKDPFSTNYGSGYGTYIIGAAQEYFYGVTFNVGTYASILTGGDAIYASSSFAKPLAIYPLTQVPNGTTVIDFMGNANPGYDAVPATTPVFEGITGLGRITTINSDAFGFMAHNSGSLTVTDGTVVNTDNASFLLKSGDVDITVSDGARLNTKDGVILQIIDNDDSLVGADFSKGAPNFYTNFYEKAGYPDIDYDTEVSTEGRNTYTFKATDVQLSGNLYNGSGYFGGQAADKLDVTLGSGASLNGTISATSVIHVDENNAQNLHFTIDEYYYLGHVANKAHYNGGNDVSVTLKDGAVWTVTGNGTLTSLSVQSGCTINGTITVNGTVKTVADIVAQGGTATGTILVAAK